VAVEVSLPPCGWSTMSLANARDFACAGRVLSGQLASMPTR
jgi:hypothetical protein